MNAEENTQKINLLQETEKALKNHHLTLHSIKYIRNSIGAIPVADFVAAARQINYNNSYGIVEIDPTLKIVGRSWWLERFSYDGHEGWVFIKKPQRPTVQAVDFSLNNNLNIMSECNWERKIEK